MHVGDLGKTMQRVQADGGPADVVLRAAGGNRTAEQLAIAAEEGVWRSCAVQVGRSVGARVEGLLLL
jgi:hypothetical protein